MIPSRRDLPTKTRSKTERATIIEAVKIVPKVRCRLEQFFMGMVGLNKWGKYNSKHYLLLLTVSLKSFVNALRHVAIFWVLQFLRSLLLSIGKLNKRIALCCYTSTCFLV